MKVLSSMALMKGTLIEIDEKGLVSQEPLRKSYDGVTYFGCERHIRNHSSGNTSIEDDCATGGLTKSRALIDFSIPLLSADEEVKHVGRQFMIRYDTKEGFLIKDLGVGFGIFTEAVGSVILKDNLLVNIGESYIVANLLFRGAEMVPKLKLRVFSVNKADTPDLYSCQHTD